MRQMAWTMALAAVWLLAVGCDADSDGVRPGRKGDVMYVEEGLPVKDVLNRIGPPLHKIEGDGVNLGMSEWVYPTGSVFVRRLVVTKVVDRPPGAPIPQPKSEFDFDQFDRFRDDRAYFDDQWRAEDAKKKR